MLQRYILKIINHIFLKVPSYEEHEEDTIKGVELKIPFSCLVNERNGKKFD